MDPWTYALSMLDPAVKSPEVSWPAQERRQIRMQELERKRGNSGRSSTGLSASSSDDDIVGEMLHARLPMSAETLAAFMGVNKQTALSRLRRLQAAGRVVPEQGAWRPLR